MEHLFESLALVIFWRFSLSVVGALFIGGAIAFLFPSIGPEVVVLSFLIGATLGLVWQGSHSHKSSPIPVQEPPMSRFVAFLGLALVGGVWGGLAAGFASRWLVLVALAVSPFLFGPIIGAFQKRRFSLRQLLFSACALVAGLVVPMAIQSAAAIEASNPSIERTSPGEPGAASHVKR